MTNTERREEDLTAVFAKFRSSLLPVELTSLFTIKIVLLVLNEYSLCYFELVLL